MYFYHFVDLPWFFQSKLFKCRTVNKFHSSPKQNSSHNMLCHVKIFLPVLNINFLSCSVYIHVFKYIHKKLNEWKNDRRIYDGQLFYDLLIDSCFGASQSHMIPRFTESSDFVRTLVVDTTVLDFIISHGRQLPMYTQIGHLRWDSDQGRPSTGMPQGAGLDANSLYPFSMSFDMPTGPCWSSTAPDFVRKGPAPSAVSNSQVAIEWLEFETRQRSTQILHAGNGPEVRIGTTGVPLDGFTPSCMAFNFQGCFWHQCDKCQDWQFRAKKACLESFFNRTPEDFHCYDDMIKDWSYQTELYGWPLCDWMQYHAWWWQWAGGLLDSRDDPVL